MRCSVSESRSALVLFNEMALEGYPSVAFGAGAGYV